MPQTDDTYELLERLLREEGSAWGELVRRYSGLLLETARRTFGSYGFAASYHDREDAVAAVWQNLLAQDLALVRQCLERRNLLPTLYVLVRNRCVDTMRRQKMHAEPITDDCLVAAPESETPGGLPVSPEKGIEALEKLAPRERTLVQLFYLRDLKYREISDLTGIPMNSIGPMLGRALEKLRKILLAAAPEE